MADETVEQDTGFQIEGGKARRGRPSRETREELARAQDREKFGEDFDPVAALQGMSFSQDLLPTPPKIEGFDLIWLTTNGISDTIATRQKAGYLPVHPDEIPGFAATIGQNPQGSAPIVKQNEMVLYKIRSDLQKRLMEHYHREKPMDSLRRMSKQYDEDRARFGRGGFAVFGRPDE